MSSWVLNLGYLRHSGSRTIKLVVVDSSGRILERFQSDTGFDPMAIANALIEKVSFNHIMATGYGRNLDREILIPSDPQLAGAYGAALLAAETFAVPPG